MPAKTRIALLAIFCLALSCSAGLGRELDLRKRSDQRQRRRLDYQLRIHRQRQLLGRGYVG